MRKIITIRNKIVKKISKKVLLYHQILVILQPVSAKAESD